MRVCRYTWPFPFGVRLGWASTRTPNPDRHSAPGRIYLLRGNAVVFSRGLGLLCGQLRRSGFWAEDLRCVGDLWLVRHLAADQRSGRLRGPVVLVGHSCGGRYALYAAHELHALGIAIDLIVTLDVALPPDVPSNVKRAVNLYRSRGRLYPARPLRPAPGSAAVVENIDLSAADSPEKAWWLNHLTMTDSARVRALVLARIREAIPCPENLGQRAKV
jgi:hypothetical protein